MKKLLKLILITCGLFISNISHAPCFNKNDNLSLIYDNIWGMIYHAEKKQCDNSPRITGDGFFIHDLDNASKLKWIAISQNMLNDSWRKSLVNDNRFSGKLKYGDSIIIISEKNCNINGIWIVKDCKNKRYKNL